MQRSSKMVADVIVILACIWLFISPWVLDYDHAAGWNSTICAIVVAILALIRLGAQERVPWISQLDWINALIGIWIIISAWAITGYDTNGDKWSTVIMGIIILVFAAASEWIGMTTTQQSPPVT